MDVLVTGATGFVGGAVVERLAGTEHRVHVLVRANSDFRRLQRLVAERRVRFAFHVGNTLDRGSCRDAMARCDAVLNCAGLNSFWEPDPGRYRAINVEGVRTVMEAALDAGVGKVVHVSTAMSYGFPCDSPFDETSAPGPHVSEYARSKHEGDEVAWQMHDERGLPLVTVYLAAVVGRGDPKPVMQIREFVNGRIPAMVDSPHPFTYVDIRDAAEAIVRAMEKPGNVGERYLVGDQRVTTRQYFELIARIAAVEMPKYTLGRRVALALARALTAEADRTGKRPLMPRDLVETVYRGPLVFDASKAKRELGLRFRPIHLALADAVAEYR
jgi:dihydroflavonol-4-reductase